MLNVDVYINFFREILNVVIMIIFICVDMMKPESKSRRSDRI